MVKVIVKAVDPWTEQMETINSFLTWSKTIHEGLLINIFFRFHP